MGESEISVDRIPNKIFLEGSNEVLIKQEGYWDDINKVVKEKDHWADFVVYKIECVPAQQDVGDENA